MTNDDIARTILDDERHVVLATADADGMPWASPVWFAHESYHRVRASAPDRANIGSFSILDPDSPFDVRIEVAP